jgi:hypothetical protein
VELVPVYSWNGSGRLIPAFEQTTYNSHMKSSIQKGTRITASASLLQ